MTPRTSHINNAYVIKRFLSFALSEDTYPIQPVTDTKQFMNSWWSCINFCTKSLRSWITAQVMMNIQKCPVSPESTGGIGHKPASTAEFVLLIIVSNNRETRRWCWWLKLRLPASPGSNMLRVRGPSNRYFPLSFHGACSSSTNGEGRLSIWWNTYSSR